MHEVAFVHGQVLGALADDQHHLGLVVERLGDLRADDRLLVRHHRGEAAHEDGGKFRDVVALRAFLDVLQIVQAEADDLARPRDRQAELQPLERTSRRGRRALGEIAERLQVAVVRREHRAEIGRHLRVDRLQIDDLIALDDAEPQAAFVRNPRSSCLFGPDPHVGFCGGIVAGPAGQGSAISSLTDGIVATCARRFRCASSPTRRRARRHGGRSPHRPRPRTGARRHGSAPVTSMIASSRLRERMAKEHRRTPRRTGAASGRTSWHAAGR